jgi:hypothetical protein
MRLPSCRHHSLWLWLLRGHQTPVIDSCCATTHRTRNARKIQGPSAGPCARLHPSLWRNRTARLRAFTYVPYKPRVLGASVECRPHLHTQPWLCGLIVARGTKPGRQTSATSPQDWPTRVWRPGSPSRRPWRAEPDGGCAVVPFDSATRDRRVIGRSEARSCCSAQCAKQEGIKVFTMIRKLKSGQYRLYSRKIDPKTGKRRNLGTFPTRAKAEQHERAVQYFKRRA